MIEKFSYCDLFKEFEDELNGLDQNYWEGLYSNFDCKFLYCIIRKLKPTNILELGPRKGRTTSMISLALLTNFKKDNIHDINYLIFEKNDEFKNSISSKLIARFDNSFIIDKEFKIFSNIIDYKFDYNIKFNFIFIDGNHDYILAKWYIKNIFPLLEINGIIHIHDIYLDNDFNDLGLLKHPQTHPDIISIEVIKELYPTIYNEYCNNNEHINRFEEDEIRDYYLNNKDHFDYYSTRKETKNTGMFDNFNCSLYLISKE